MTDLQLKIKIIKAFLSGCEEYGDSNVYYYRYFEEEIVESKERIKKMMDGLIDVEMVEHVKGLINEEGQVAGSGFQLTRRATQLSIREWLVELKKINEEGLLNN